MSVAHLLGDQLYVLAVYYAVMVYVGAGIEAGLAYADVHEVADGVKILAIDYAVVVDVAVLQRLAYVGYAT